MTCPPHLAIINPSHYSRSTAALGDFSLFSLLPAELRLDIWILAMQKHRLVEIELSEPPNSAISHSYSTINDLGKVVSGQNYTKLVRGVQLYSKLLRVSREARNAALGFYRIHFQCRLQLSDHVQTSGWFYFNPEEDFLHLTSNGVTRRGYVDFLHDLKASDPRDVGLLNVALSGNDLRSGLVFIPEVQEELAKNTLSAVLSQLREIIWVAESHCGRILIEPIDDFVGAGIQFNHSMPIKGINPSFRILSSDPRLVDLDLQYVVTGEGDPRSMRVAWRELLQTCNIHPDQPARERVMFAYKPHPWEGDITSTKTAEEFLNEEQKHWLSTQHTHSRRIRSWLGRFPAEGSEELVKAVRPAVGFWLFSAEAFGSLEGYLWRGKPVFDMRKYPPELALSEIV